jgi:transposase
MSDPIDEPQLDALAAVAEAAPRPKRKYNARLSDSDRHLIVSLYVNNSMTAPEIVNSFSSGKVSLATVYSVVEKFKKRGTSDAQPPKKKQHTYSQEVAEAFAKLQEKDPDATYSELKFSYFDETGDMVSTATIHRLLKEKDFTTKKLYIEPAGRNTPEMIEKRKVYAREMIRVEEKDLIFIDEAGFNLWTRRGRGRAKKGERALLRVPNSKGRNITVIAAISPQYGLIHSQVRLGSTTGSVYAQFISDLLKRELMRVGSRIIIQDNCSIHKTDEVKEAFTESRIEHQFKYLPAYSPQLNPIEECFAKLASYVKANRQITTGNLMRVVEQGLITITQEDCQGWYRHCVRFYVDCVDGVALE